MGTCLFVHVCSRINMNERSDAGDDKQKQCTQLIKLQSKWDIYSSGFDEIKQKQKGTKLSFRAFGLLRLALR